MPRTSAVIVGGEILHKRKKRRNPAKTRVQPHFIFCKRGLSSNNKCMRKTFSRRQPVDDHRRRSDGQGVVGQLAARKRDGIRRVI
ncbi:hypothetical protein DLM86_06640 [Paenibacillus flagellatus]|uniref:Uncharacterized protein n=1 Tax=Paenibacillus flagellatus TaxID=2211139 RepID=A0A2V5KKT0_9BACL|nr:hypothetical protein DLM86_06640 [Paenibacillus flagellatus]